MPSLLDRVDRKPGNGNVRPTAAALGSTPVPENQPAAEQAITPIEGVVEEEARVRWNQLRRWMVEQLMATIPSAGELTRTPESTRLIVEHVSAALEASGAQLPPAQQSRLQAEVLSEMLGCGPLDPLLADPTITEIMANGPALVFVERDGQLQETNVRFDDDAHMVRIVDRIIRPLERRLDRKRPMVDARLPDGSRVNAIIPPSAIDGPALTIRKFTGKKLTVEDLISSGSLTQNISEFLRACVLARLNIIVSGGPGSGKTTLLNVLSNFIPANERIVTIEDSAELQLNRRHVVRLEAKPAELDGTGRVEIRDLVTNALRMRPDRIVVGECRSAEALDMLQAMNTGHDGSLTTLHANSPRDAISRLETMTLMAGLNLPVRVIREQIAAAIDLVVQQARLRDGSRKIIRVTEVQGMEGDVLVLQDIFRFVERGFDPRGKVVGDIVPTGIRPKFTSRLQVAGLELPPEIFGAAAFADVRRR